MKQEATKPTVKLDEKGGDKTVVKSHPAFGKIQFSRITGGAKLFGSSITSEGFIRIEARPAVEEWHLHSSKTFGSATPLFVADLTHAQFAQLITTMNMGDGVPCTLRRVGKEFMPDFIDEDNLQEQIENDLNDDVKEVTAMIDNLKKDLEETLAASNLSLKKKDELRRSVDKIRMTLAANMPFIVKQYQRALSKVAISAKADMDSWLTTVISRLGFKSLKEIAAKADAADKKIEN